MILELARGQFFRRYSFFHILIGFTEQTLGHRSAVISNVLACVTSKTFCTSSEPFNKRAQSQSVLFKKNKEKTITDTLVQIDSVRGRKSGPAEHGDMIMI